MAITPDEILNKDFRQTTFRPGYDKDEVDGFLDEIRVEMSSLLEELESLRQTTHQDPSTSTRTNTTESTRGTT